MFFLFYRGILKNMENYKLEGGLNVRVERKHRYKKFDI